MTPPLQIAIDGPAGAGKSTIGKAVAKKLGILYLDTGAMYRTLALFALRNGVDPEDGAAVAGILPKADIRVVYSDGEQRMLLSGEDVTGLIRTPEISKGASDISVHQVVRQKLVEMQRQTAEENDVVMDGRDICTVVLPSAQHKFFVTASPASRACRRLLEMQQKNEHPLPSLAEMEEMIRARDHTDSTRACAPLRQADDAVLIDTTELSIEESVNAVLNRIYPSK